MVCAWADQEHGQYVYTWQQSTHPQIILGVGHRAACRASAASLHSPVFIGSLSSNIVILCLMFIQMVWMPKTQGQGWMKSKMGPLTYDLAEMVPQLCGQILLTIFGARLWSAYPLSMRTLQKLLQDCTEPVTTGLFIGLRLWLLSLPMEFTLVCTDLGSHRWMLLSVWKCKQMCNESFNSPKESLITHFFPLQSGDIFCYVRSNNQVIVQDVGPSSSIL